MALGNIDTLWKQYAIDKISPTELRFPNTLLWTSWGNLRTSNPWDAGKIEKRTELWNAHITTFRFSAKENAWKMPQEDTVWGNGVISNIFQAVDWTSPRSTDQYAIVGNILYRKRDGVIYATPLINPANTRLAPNPKGSLETSWVRSFDIKITFDEMGVSKVSIWKTTLDIPMQRYTPEQFTLIKDYIQKIIVHTYSLEQQWKLSREIKMSDIQRLQVTVDAIAVNNRDWLPDTRVLSNKRIQEIFLAHESTELEDIKKKLILFMNTVLVGMNQSTVN
jgi:hypothetical protein